MNSLEIVNHRMQAYNSHNLEDFIALYAEDIEIYTYPDSLLGKGKAHLQSIFEPLFSKKSVHVDIHYQLSKDSYVINHETVSYNDNKVDYVSIYEVKNSLIQSVRFIRD